MCLTLTEETTPEEFVISKVSELESSSKSVNLRVKAVSHTEEREVQSRKDFSTHRVCEVLVGDVSATVLMTVWDDLIDAVKDGTSYMIKNGYTSLFRGNIRLNIGRYGEIEESEEAVEEINEETNVSDQTFEQPRRRSYDRGGGGGGGYGGGGGGQRDRRFSDRRGGRRY